MAKIILAKSLPRATKFLTALVFKSRPLFPINLQATSQRRMPVELVKDGKWLPSIIEQAAFGIPGHRWQIVHAGQLHRIALTVALPAHQ